MARTSRATALIRMDDVGLPIRRERSEQAIERLEHFVGLFDDSFIFNVATEIGLDECLSYGEEGGSILFDMTDIQVVAMCAALAACAEYREGRRKRARR